MPRETFQQKAARLVAAGRVSLCGPFAIVIGDHGTYELSWQETEWQCPCGSRRRRCSHVLAVELVRAQRVETERDAREREIEQEEHPMSAQQPQTTAPPAAMVVAPPLRSALVSAYPDPHELATMKEFAAMLIESHLVPSTLNTPAKVILALEMGRELGMKPLASMNNLYVINDKVTLMNNGAVGIVQSSGNLAGMKVDEQESYCEVWTKRRDNGQEYCNTWSMVDAAKAGLSGGQNWRKYPKQMLRARALFENLRVNFADVLMGMYSPEEIGAEVAFDDSGNMRVVSVDVEEPAASSPPAHDATGMPSVGKPGAVDERPGHDAATGEVIPDGDFTAEEAPAEAAAPAWQWDPNMRGKAGVKMARLGIPPEDAEKKLAAVTSQPMMDDLSKELTAEDKRQKAAGTCGVWAPPGEDQPPAAEAVAAAPEASGSPATAPAAPPPTPAENSPVETPTATPPAPAAPAEPDGDEALSDDPFAEGAGKGDEGDEGGIGTSLFGNSADVTGLLKSAAEMVKGDAVPPGLMLALGNSEVLQALIAADLGIGAAGQEALLLELGRGAWEDLKREERLTLYWMAQERAEKQ